MSQRENILTKNALLGSGNNVINTGKAAIWLCCMYRLKPDYEQKSNQCKSTSYEGIEERSKRRVREYRGYDGRY